ncbi:hypothetical protein GGH99_004609 [Coemansia sp. RSA 1285]|nr:hypothetical protein GGH99_004609 [Coemansia sp. RSA 1285]
MYFPLPKAHLPPKRPTRLFRRLIRNAPVDSLGQRDVAAGNARGLGRDSKATLAKQKANNVERNNNEGLEQRAAEAGQEAGAHVARLSYVASDSATRGPSQPLIQRNRDLINYEL